MLQPLTVELYPLQSPRLRVRDNRVPPLVCADFMTLEQRH